jgi:hypothetical protein
VIYLSSRLVLGVEDMRGRAEGLLARKLGSQLSDQSANGRVRDDDDRLHHDAGLRC